MPLPPSLKSDTAIRRVSGHHSRRAQARCVSAEFLNIPEQPKALPHQFRQAALCTPGSSSHNYLLTTTYFSTVL